MFRRIPSIVQQCKSSVTGMHGARQGPLSALVMPKRFLNLHEYQSKQWLKKYGVSVQESVLVGEDGLAPADGVKALNLPADGEYVVKSQVHAGGRGKGFFKETGYKGGVQIVKTAEEALAAVDAMMGKHLVTKQTTDEGVLVRKVMLAEALDIAKEYYFAIVMDRTYGGPVMVASREGGMDIEEVAENRPENIHKVAVSLRDGVTRAQCVELAQKMSFGPDVVEAAADQIAAMYRFFVEKDVTQLEINPLVETPDKKVMAFDAKVTFDDNAEFRQAAVFAERDPFEEDPREVAAAEFDLNYIGLDGNIGCMVNGAGLAMATMDIIAKYGGSPANFLDVGGGATEKQVMEAFKLLRSDPKVEAILVNIFGGIMKCDVIAAGVVSAAKQLNLDIPVVVRLEGTNVAEGKELLTGSGVAIIAADDLDDAAQKAVKAIS